MLCTRCQQREARPFGRGTPEERAAREARFEAEFGTPWPFPEGLCRECGVEWFKSPEGRAKMEPMQRAMEARWKEHVEKWKDDVRARVLKVLDVADAIAGKL